MSKRVIIIGSGVGGLASACLLAKAGYNVELFEKNKQLGGKAGQFKAKGFTFDTGPSWLLMPEVFEHFFDLLGEDIDKLLPLKRLSPSYQVTFKDTLLGAVKIYGNPARDIETLQTFEPNSKEQLKEYMSEVKSIYKIALEEFLYRNYNSRLDLVTPKNILKASKLNVLSNLDDYVAKRFISPEARAILTYPSAFLGTDPARAPALYRLLSHIDFAQGVYYPKGGMYKLIESLHLLAKQYGVKVHRNYPVDKILIDAGRATGVQSKGKEYKADVVISNTDRHHTETVLLDPKYRGYPASFWKKSTYGPSALLIYLGVSGKIQSLQHHNLIFAREWNKKFSRLFSDHKLPNDPSFYLCMPSKTNKTTAKKNHESLFVLVPVPAGLAYKDEKLEAYSKDIIRTLQTSLHIPDLEKRIVYKKLFCRQDFETEFNAYRGSAFGLSHTLRQSATFRPSNKHKKISNLLFVGADTTPGVGLPMCIISAELAYKRIINDSSPGPLKKL